jgi:hypothetical protein
MEGYSVRQLSKMSGHSTAKLYRLIDHWLSHPLSDSQSLIQHRHIVFDGTFLHRPCSIVALMNGQTHRIIAGKYGISENSEPALTAFLVRLKDCDLTPKSATVDGNPQVIKVLKLIWPQIIIQRCLVHIQRQGLMWLRQKPKRQDALLLRELFLQVTQIKTTSQKLQFLKNLQFWENAYGILISQKPERGRVFSDLKRARSMLLKALPDMFHYLADSNIPATTNGLEGYFSRLKRDYRNHRGLMSAKRLNYFSWYLYLKNK